MAVRNLEEYNAFISGLWVNNKRSCEKIQKPDRTQTVKHGLGTFRLWRIGLLWRDLRAEVFGKFGFSR
jgi:hypothetical protein